MLSFVQQPLCCARCSPGPMLCVAYADMVLVSLARARGCRTNSRPKVDVRLVWRLSPKAERKQGLPDVSHFRHLSSMCKLIRSDMGAKDLNIQVHITAFPTTMFLEFIAHQRPHLWPPVPCVNDYGLSLSPFFLHWKERSHSFPYTLNGCD